MSGILFFIFASCHPLSQKKYVSRSTSKNCYAQCGFLFVISSIGKQQLQFPIFLLIEQEDKHTNNYILLQISQEQTQIKQYRYLQHVTGRKIILWHVFLLFQWFVNTHISLKKKRYAQIW